MNDSADMKSTTLTEAAQRLNQALESLEDALDPLVTRYAKLQTQAKEAESFSQDRIKLAAQLDEALEARQKREAEFQTLSAQTREEIDLTIQALKDALGNAAQAD
jgi:predicted  nucleic acid-binding Zn-ribbon protein